MFSKSKKDPVLDPEQHQQVENAQKRIRHKKQLYSHLVFFLVGGVFLLALNKILKYGEAYDWSYWVLLAWGVLLVLHAVDVFITKRLLGPDWERTQRDKLVRKQQERIAKMEAEIERDMPLPDTDVKRLPQRPGASDAGPSPSEPWKKNQP